MMYYFIQVNILLIVFYLIYKLLLSQLTFYKLNRLVLLLIPIISFIIPFLRPAELNVVAASYMLPMVSLVNEDLAFTEFQTSTNWTLLLGWVYIAGLTFFASRFLVTISNLIGYLQKIDFKNENGLRIAIVSNNEQSFSFFNYIVINQKDIEIYDMIVSHEKVHVRLLHSVDKVCAELLSSIFWFNPITHYMKKDISNNHEFEVDNILGTSKEEGEYIRGLSQTLPILSEKKLANSFNSNSNLLKRITMMTKNPSNGASKLNYLLLIPAAVLAILSFSCAEQLEDNLNSDVSVKTNPPPPPPPPVPDDVYSGDRVNEVTEMPMYTGGNEALYAFMAEAIKYPEEAKKEGLSGVVYISFVVDSKGVVTDVEVAEGVHPVLDNAALEVVKKMPAWVPGKIGDKEVAVEFMLPISFKLDNSDAGGKKTNE